ncbi:PREDICTED: mediator of RNA polymerase II transcription subunit 15-like [Amphimedon queenslandica]|uniref:Mediator complex subunit 15 n=1 Tax=Amphimedon queenslandica TaxID=400682 RepID=A0AAN0IKH0_AMPQE|nr:PREDICTED: mediator of RNA polymerase II transcription subunit 15-like [Amphimedon queenslandica]|eukprot:XP_011402838.1 PREDICTED: mediator of RNA polymerase II transcription subunit 15-like [Amphimedon queenslandica]
MGVTMRPFNMMNRAHPAPQRASLATNMPGSGEQVVSAVPNPSFPAPAATGEIQHPPGAPSPFTNHPSPYHPPPSVPPPSSVPPPQSSTQPAQANSPKAPQSVPSPRVSHPIPSPGTPWNPNSPSNTASPSQPPPPSNQPSLTPEGSNAVLLKLQELQCYIPLLARMIDRLQRGNEKDKGRTDQLTKLTSLYNVLQSKNMKVPLQTLEKCHIALKRIFEKDASITSQPPPGTTQAPPQSQPTTTSTATVTTNVETSNNAVTTTASSVTPPRPPVPPTPPLSASMSLLDFKILHSPPPLSSYLQPLLEDREETDPLDRLPLNKKRKLEEQASKSFILGIKRELVDINNYTIRKVSPKNSLEVNGSLCLEFTLVDDSLPAVPPLVMTLSPNYPRSSPHLQFNTDSISSPPIFLKELEETFPGTVTPNSGQLSRNNALTGWKSTV